jgi:hypothetical protein
LTIHDESSRVPPRPAGAGPCLGGGERSATDGRFLITLRSGALSAQEEDGLNIEFD